jgi:predicted nucleic acid-binding protein
MQIERKVSLFRNGRNQAKNQQAGKRKDPNWLCALDLTVVTANMEEFTRVPELKVENWI